MSWMLDAHDWIAELVRDEAPVKSAMNELVTRCAAEHPHADWPKFKKLDIEPELPLLERWLRNVLTNEPPAPNITAFWFGLYNPATRNTVRTEMYVAGSNRYAGNASPIDWQCGPDYWPGDRYAGSRVLAQLYTYAYSGRKGLQNDAEYPLALGYAAFAVAHLCRTLPAPVLLAGAKERAAVVGFDSGDYLTVGDIRQNGFEAAAHA